VNPALGRLEDKPNFYDLTRDDLARILDEMGEPKYRANQIWEGVYKHLWEDPADFYPIPKTLRDRLSESFRFRSVEDIQALRSKDRKSEKLLFRTNHGDFIESVLMIYKERRTLCISSQSGCPVGCVFCATGQMGFISNLSSGIIIEQVLHSARILKEANDRLTNIVVMGMGEPFLNYDATMSAIRTLNDLGGFGMSARRFTISTVGIIPGIQRFANDHSQVNLAVSLHAPNDALRNQLIPTNKKYPVKDLMDACREYVETTRRRITFEYALINGVNDSVELARELSLLLKGLLCHVNLIQLNPSDHYQKNGSDLTKAKSFLGVLQKNGIPATLRLRMGLDIKAGCGQLAHRDSPLKQ
jgi:23S rRNA (adenine2503-C2)-methyltransferase